MATRRRNDGRPGTGARPTAPEAGSESAPAPEPDAKRPSRRRSGDAAKQRLAAQAGPLVSPEARRTMVAEAAYLRAERRGFAAGREEEDWLMAEKEVDALLSARHSGRQ